jgi:hypothetical protein
MIFFDVLYFLILGLSVSYMYSFSKIFEPVRNFVSKIPYLRRPLLCPECASFWFGFEVSFLYNPIHLNYTLPFLTNIFCGLIVHLFACFLYKNRDNKINFIN